MRILIATSLLQSVDENVYANHFALAYHLGKISAERKWEFFHFAPTRLSIDRTRNEAGRLALQLECDYLVFIDDDMLLQPDTIEKLIEADKDIVMAHTYIRGYPFKPMSFVREPLEDPADIKLRYFDEVMEKAENNLSKCDAVGFATVAIKTHLLKELKAPWFITGPNGTEDIYFCLRCLVERKEPTGIYVRTDVPTFHKLSPEFVGEPNVAKLREFYKPETEVSEGRQDRGKEYYDSVKDL